MPSGAEGFDTNGRPDDLLKRITYNANNYGKGAFLFADADAGPEDESRARRNRFPKRENLELEQKLYETMERQADEVVKARLAEAEKAAKEFNWDVYVDPDANAPVGSRRRRDGVARLLDVLGHSCAVEGAQVCFARDYDAKQERWWHRALL